MASNASGRSRLPFRSRWAPVHSNKPEEKAHALGIYSLYEGFTSEEKTHYSHSLAKLGEVKMQLQAGQWSSKAAAAFLGEIERVIGLGEVAAQPGKDPRTIERELQIFFAAKAEVLAEIYSAGPGEMIKANVGRARELLRESRTKGDRERANFAMEGVTLPVHTEQYWTGLKVKEDTLEQVERARRSLEWVRDLVKLSYEMETAEALLPKDVSEQKKISHSIGQLREAKEQALIHKNEGLVDECASLIARIEDEPRTHEDWTELTGKKAKVLVNVWSVYHNEKDKKDAVKSALGLARTDLLAVSEMELLQRTEFTMRYGALRNEYIKLKHPNNQAHPKLLEDALYLKYAADQLMFDMKDAEGHEHESAHLELARDDHRRSIFARVSQRTARRYQL